MRPEAERIERKWLIKKKARDSKYATDIEQIRVVTTCRRIADPQLHLYRMGIIHCLEGIDEHLDDVNLEEDVAMHHKIIRLVSTVCHSGKDMELSYSSDGEEDGSDDDDDRSSNTSSSGDESERKGEKSKRSRSKGKGKGKGKSSRK